MRLFGQAITYIDAVFDIHIPNFIIIYIEDSLVPSLAQIYTEKCLTCNHGLSVCLFSTLIEQVPCSVISY